MKKIILFMVIVLVLVTSYVVAVEESETYTGTDTNIDILLQTTDNINAYLDLYAGGNLTINLNGIITNGQYPASSSSSRSAINYISNSLDTATTGGKLNNYQAKFMNALARFMYNYYNVNIAPSINMLYSYALAQDESLDYMYEEFSKNESVNFEDIKCIGRVRYMYKYNVSSVECNGFKFINNGEYNRGFGAKIVPVEQKPKNDSKPEYIVVDQTELLKQFATWCQEATDEGYLKGIITYCNTECNDGRSNQCVCKTGVKIMRWITEPGTDHKYASYRCLDDKV